jgi:WD40 repeat protein|mmetsp:Transcript_43008/g.56907  ORF Transcript_43008/g.56907 Transcript_43008/m.56907 type:complete len:83 (-) Transcript_43008:1108-1356(-)
MAVCDESNKLFVVTAGKKILVFDTESQEKVCEVANAHGKGIYGVRVAPAGQEASIVTCSSDNTLKTWKLDAESKQLSELATI